MRRLFVFLLVMLVYAPSTRAQLRGTDLGTLTDDSKMIVEGRVVQVASVVGVRIAHLEVHRTLKGDPVSDAYFVADASFSCDISDARPDERGLYFLSEHSFAPNPLPRPATRDSDETFFGYPEYVGFREEVLAFARGNPVYDLAHSGIGRLLSRHNEDGETFLTSHLSMPSRIGASLLPSRIGNFDSYSPKASVLAYVAEQAIAARREPRPRKRTPN